MRRRLLAPTPAKVPRLWPDSTIACLATGPSLTAADCDYVRGKVDAVIAISNAIDLAPWADVLYSCDAKWWFWRKGAPEYTGRKYTLAPQAAKYPGVELLVHTGTLGLELHPAGVRTGKNSGYQAINLAVHLGAKRIVLLGYDMRGEHFFGRHPDGSKPPFHLCIPKFKTLLEPLRALGVEVVNCSPRTAIDAFPVRPLAEVLPCRSQPAA
jgi:hypothetical protein